MFRLCHGNGTCDRTQVLHFTLLQVGRTLERALLAFDRLDFTEITQLAQSGKYILCFDRTSHRATQHLRAEQQF